MDSNGGIFDVKLMIRLYHLMYPNNGSSSYRLILQWCSSQWRRVVNFFPSNQLGLSYTVRSGFRTPLQIRHADAFLAA